MKKNPLLHIEFEIPFDKIRASHVQPAVEQLITDAARGIRKIAAKAPRRTWANTMHAYDVVTQSLDRAVGVVKHLEGVATTPAMRKAFNKAEPLITSLYSRISIDAGLYKAVDAYARTREARALTGPRKRFVEKTLSAFRKYGAALPPAQKKKLEKIDVELATVTTKFSQNVLDATNSFELIVTSRRKLAGLPPSAIEMAREDAKRKGKKGWRFTLQAPSFTAVMTYLDDASIREKIYRAYQTRASGGRWDNKANILRILELRAAKARLLKFADFADYAIDERMAVNGARAQAFLDDIKHRTLAHFHRENDELNAFRKQLEGSDAPPLEAWDIGYYAEKFRKAKYDLDEELLRPYFPLEKVVVGMFEIVERLFGVKVTLREGVAGWDPAVNFYDIRDAGGTHLGSFYTDWFPRENKRGGAWMDAFITGGPNSGPHLGLMCGNMTPPSGGKPALLTHREVETVFHEFGHLLHHCLSRAEIRLQAGTNVAWDFVELPSQIMENWCWERPALDLFARHYKTGAPLPVDLFEKLLRTRGFRAANFQMRQLSFGCVDLALHRQYAPKRDGDVVAYCRAILAEFTPAILPDDHSMITAFTHLFANAIGYAAGYYSYKWAEVLDADAFTAFQKEGIFSRQTGMRFRESILARGDSEDPAVLYRSFMGRDPDADALFARVGLV